MTTEQRIKWMIRILVIACAGSVAADFVYHRHAELGFDGLPAFYAFVGFVSYCFIVLGAKSLRRFLRRPEDYYDD